MCRCLFELKRFKESQECLTVYKSHFPTCAREAVTALEKDLAKATSESTTNRNPEGGRSSSERSSSDAPQTRRNFLIRFRRSSSDRSTSNDEAAETSPTRDEHEATTSAEETDSHSSAEVAGDDNDDETVIDNSDESGTNGRTSKRNPMFLEYEQEYKNNAVDYMKRFCGHCNTTTDIKEANFFGDFIVAGSDDGSFFIWNRETTNIVKIMKGDESIVNCLQPHPSSCCLATSGIESVVRIWTPMPEVTKFKINQLVNLYVKQYVPTSYICLLIKFKTGWTRE